MKFAGKIANKLVAPTPAEIRELLSSRPAKTIHMLAKKLALPLRIVYIAIRAGILLLSGISLTAGTTFAQDALPRGIPEKEGVSSSSIMDFVNAANHSKSELHSFIYVRHGKVIAEGWWNPYNPTTKQTLYSTSKSFTAAAV